MRPSKSTLVLAVILSQGLTANAPAQDLAEADIVAGTAGAQELMDGALRAQALRDRDAYLRTISELEARPGNYGSELGEAWFGLGTTLRALDAQEQAAEAFGKALQALRIGHGLNDVRQLPVLQQLRETNERLANWDEVHSANSLAYHIASHSAEADEALRIELLLALGRWLRRAAADDLVSDVEANAQVVKTLYNSELKRLEAAAEYSGRSLHLAALYLDLADTELGEAKRKYELPIVEFQAPGAGDQRTTITQQCFSGTDRNGRQVTVCNQPIELPNMNYYLAPNAQKNMEIRTHLAEVERNVMAAYHTLQGRSGTQGKQDTLLSEIQRLTSEYNAFVAANPR